MVAFIVFVAAWEGFCRAFNVPRFLLPNGLSFETERDGRFCFDVEIAPPLIGMIVAYRGSLEPSAA